MSKLKGILLTQGMHGMISQVEGLAKALDVDFTHHTVELNSFWKVIPPKLTPISQNVYKKINQDDKIYEDNGVKILVDKKSFLYLIGTTLEFSGGLNGKGFVFNNPNANRTCGCGESFSL